MRNTKENPMEFSNIQFDYLIVGGGTAGLVVAARLSEDPQAHVGVIEAGPSALNGEDEGSITVPGRYGETIGSHYDWKFETIPQPGLMGRSLAWPRGRVLGGTSALNFMAWNRGHRDDYDAWVELGNPGWGWNDLLPYFLRSETFHPPTAEHQKYYNSSYQAEFNGSQGPIQTTHIKQYGQAHQYWHETLNTLGISSTDDSLTGRNSGAWNMVCSIDPSQQTRSYSASAYYAPVAARGNLHVITNATVLNIILEGNDSGWTATGVRVRKEGQVFEAKPRREIILSAGSVQSPQILELSGVGPRNILQAAGIEVKVENKNVGENLQDHMMFASIYEVLPTLSSRDDIVNNPVLREAADRAYATSKTGPWTILPCSVAYCSLSDIMPGNEDSSPGIKQSIPGQTSEPRGANISTQNAINYGQDRGHIEYIFDLGNWSPFFTSDPNKKYATMLQMLQYPLSRGSIHIQAQSDAKYPVTVDDKPIIDPKYYLGPGQYDKSVMTLARKFADKICETEPLSQITKGRVFPPPDEDSDTSNTQSDEHFMEEYTITDWHRESLKTQLEAGRV
ncbi:hypothetical protein VI817_001775 [Penicillium citrinum]|nr:hypothetical protein VI817_001775 [Penicillium citrinum]